MAVTTSSRSYRFLPRSSLALLAVGLAFSSVGTARGAATGPEAAPPLTEADFKAPVTLTAHSLDMDEFVAALREQTHAPLKVDDKIKDLKVSARLRRRPLADVLNGLKDLYGFGSWTYQKSGEYVLTEGNYRKRREEAKAEEFRIFQDRLDALRKKLADDPHFHDPINVAARQLVAMSPDAYAGFLKTGDYSVPFDSLSATDQEGLRWQMSQSWVVKNGVKHPTPEEIPQAVFQLQIVRNDQGISLLGGYRFPASVAGSGSGVRLAPGESAPSGNGFRSLPKGGNYNTLLPPSTQVPGIMRSMERNRQNGVSFLGEMGPELADDKELPEGQRRHQLYVDTALYDPALADPGDTAREDESAGKGAKSKPMLPKKVSVRFPPPRKGEEYTGEPNTPLSPTDDAFDALANQADLDFISDSFIRPPVRPEEIKDQPLSEALDRLADPLDTTWTRDKTRSFFLFRNRRWYLDEDRQVSGKAARPWLRYWNRRKTLPEAKIQLKEVAALCSMFTADQMDLMGQFLPLARRVQRAAAPFALYEALPEKQRKELTSEEGLRWAALPPKARDLFMERVPADVTEAVAERLKNDPDSRFRVIPEADRIRSELSDHGKWITDIDLPTRMTEFDRPPGGRVISDGDRVGTPDPDAPD